MRFLLVTSRLALLAILLPSIFFDLITSHHLFHRAAEGLLRSGFQTSLRLATLFFTFLSFKRELVGGLSILILGTISVVVFENSEHFYWLVFSLTALVPIFGLLIVLAQLQIKQSD